MQLSIVVALHDLWFVLLLGSHPLAPSAGTEANLRYFLASVVSRGLASNLRERGDRRQRDDVRFHRRRGGRLGIVSPRPDSPVLQLPPSAVDR